ncbi:MAG: YheT family hydrolase [Steroidobacteraceae bacterium]
MASAPTASHMLAAFNPPAWLRNGHLQSTLPALYPWCVPIRLRSRQLRAVAQREVFETAQGVRLLAACSVQNAANPWVLILHGWLGDADSTYVLSLAAKLYAAGYNICRLNLRDHGDTEHLNPGLFHSCLLDEVVEMVHVIQQRYAISDLSLAGFSLGGNFVLRVAARAAAADICLRKVLAICPALNPHASDVALATGPGVYRNYFLSKWKQVLKRKQQCFPGQYRFDEMMATNSITELTDVLVRNHAGFSGVRDYYDGYSLLGTVLSTVVVPSYLLLAKDDPIVPIDDVRFIATNPQLHITISQYGGHCGFMSDVSGQRWADEWALHCLQQA